MKEKILFQFKILQYVHDSFTGEFLNVGIALYSQTNAYFRVKLLTRYSRITNTFPNADGEYYHRYISSLQTQFDRLVEKVNAKQLPIEPWLPDKIDELLSEVLPSDDSAIQFGSTKGGMTIDLDATFDDLYHRLVEAYIPEGEHLSRTEQEIWNLFSPHLRKQSVISLLRPTVIKTAHDDIELDHAWKNGKWKALQPISFDLMHAGTIKNKARLWLGINVSLDQSPEISNIYYLLGKPRREETAIQKAYLDARDLLGTGDYAKKIEIIEEDAAEDFANSISPLIKSDTEQKD